MTELSTLLAALTTTPAQPQSTTDVIVDNDPETLEQGDAITPLAAPPQGGSTFFDTQVNQFGSNDDEEEDEEVSELPPLEEVLAPAGEDGGNGNNNNGVVDDGSDLPPFDGGNGGDNNNNDGDNNNNGGDNNNNGGDNNNNGGDNNNNGGDNNNNGGGNNNNGGGRVGEGGSILGGDATGSPTDRGDFSQEAFGDLGIDTSLLDGLEADQQRVLEGDLQRYRVTAQLDAASRALETQVLVASFQEKITNLFIQIIDARVSNIWARLKQLGAGFKY